MTARRRPSRQIRSGVLPRSVLVSLVMHGTLPLGIMLSLPTAPRFVQEGPAPVVVSFEVATPGDASAEAALGATADAAAPATEARLVAVPSPEAPVAIQPAAIPIVKPAPIPDAAPVLERIPVPEPPPPLVMPALPDPPPVSAAQIDPLPDVPPPPPISPARASVPAPPAKLAPQQAARPKPTPARSGTQLAGTRESAPGAGPPAVAQLQSDEGPLLITAPRFRVPPVPPSYPRAARDQGQEGEVLVRANLDLQGNPSDVVLVRSSGWEVLDRAALAAVRRWAFEPGRRGGIAVMAWVQIPVRFTLR